MNDHAAAQPSGPILWADGLGFIPANAREPALADISLHLGKGEVVAVLGRRASGRAVLRDLILGLRPRGQVSGTFERTKEGRRIAYLPSPLEAPLSRHGNAARQLARILALRNRVSYAKAEHLLRATLGSLPGAPRLDDLSRRAQDLNRRNLSLGLLALALAQNPDVILADESASHLDPVEAEEFLGLLLSAHAELGFALLYFTGNPVVAARLGGRIAVLRDGRLIEEGSSEVLGAEQQHRYTQTLFQAAPLLRETIETASGVRGEPLLEVRNFAMSPLAGGPADQARVLTFELRKGAGLALIGVEGSGRRALARAVLGLDRAPQGQIIFDALDVGVLSPQMRRRLRKRIGFVSGDDAVLDPRMTVLETVTEPIRAQVHLGREQIARAANAALQRARLGHIPGRRLAGELDLMQRRRLQVARAMAAAAQLVVLYEPLSGLGALGQALMLDLLKEWRAFEPVAILLATADFTVAQALAEHALVLRDGLLVESGPVAGLIRAPTHAYTRALVEAAWRRTRLEPPALSPSPA